METIKPVMQYVEHFTVTGFCVKTKNIEETDPVTAKIPALWQQFYSSDLSSHTPVFGVYSGYESDTSGFYTVTVGVSHKSEPANINKVVINSGNYLVFSGSGPMPATVIEIWKQIWAYFPPETKYQRNFITDFEVYRDPDHVAIYIGIE